MGTVKSNGVFGFLKSMKDAVAIIISLISIIISTVNVYVTNLKAPDLSMIVAPYINQIVDSQSLNESFFIPLTVINRGAKPGSILSFELNITYLPTGAQETFYGQYFAHQDVPEIPGELFAPMNLDGYSAVSRTVCFYPLGEKAGNFFAQIGTYEFTVVGMSANVKGEAPKRIFQDFRIELTQEMYDQMQKEPDLEYSYPMRIETSSNGR
jgi:hypothetical protein